MSIRDKLLRIFEGETGQFISGEVLAREMGVSRTAVWKQIQSLKSDGFPISGTGRLGYRLNGCVDSSLVLWKPPSWVVPHYSLITPSTQIAAKAGAAAGLPEGHLWMAEIQSKGRGRLDRHWVSRYGGLWFSLLLRPKLPARQVPPLTLLAGLALLEAVRNLSDLDVKLKWPNDLVVQRGRSWVKIAGILTEMAGQMERTDWVVIGAGLNVVNSIPSELASLAASVQELTGKYHPRAKFLSEFLKRFYISYRRYHESGFEPFRRRYWSHYFAPAHAVQLNTALGKVTGIARGVDDSGAIMIESRRKMVSISEGEIVTP